MLRVPKLWRNEHLLPGDNIDNIDDYVDCDDLDYDDDDVCIFVCLFVMLIYSAAELGICGK